MKTLIAAGTVLFLFGCGAAEGTDAPEATEQGVSAAPALPPQPGLPGDYETRSANAKLSVLWNERILPSTYTARPEWAAVKPLKLLTEILSDSFKRTADERPATPKVVHALGSVVKVEYIADSGIPYTGLFKGGVGVGRFSLANDPNGAYVPGFALKLLADGQPSGNMVVMFSVDGQGENQDFFAGTFSNIVPDPGTFAGRFVSTIFSFVIPDPGKLGIASFAHHDRLGRVEAAPLAPAQVFFVPAPSVKAVPRASRQGVDLRVDLEAIPEGTTLYDVLASRNVGEAPTHLGKVLTTSSVVASQFADQNLFFKHEAP